MQMTFMIITCIFSLKKCQLIFYVNVMPIKLKKKHRGDVNIVSRMSQDFFFLLFSIHKYNYFFMTEINV